MTLFPAIDILDGKVARLEQGDFARSKTYDADPAEAARRFADEGAEWLHVVDLDGAKTGSPKALRELGQIGAIGLKIQFGGGIRSLASAHAAFAAGAARVVMGTALVKDRPLAEQTIVELKDRLVGGLDCREGKVAVSGWLEQSDADAIEIGLRLAALGLKRIVLTDIARDGVLQGPNVQFLREFASRVNLPVIASGGVSSAQDLAELSQLPGIEGAIIGKALYEGRFTLAEALAATRS